MNILAQELFVGPAVVVDDEVEKAGTAAYVIVKELEEAHFPVLRRHFIPPDDEVFHWQTMSLIVLDWNLLGTRMVANGEDSAESDGSALFGVALPDSARADPKTDSRRFVRKLIRDLYCPIFIISNVNVAAIWGRLEDGLNEYDIQQLRARVLIRSKTQAEGSLLEVLAEWIKEHPAIYALKTWERGYERAKAELFRDFQQSAVGWPGILWQTSGKDRINPHHSLTETISRNLLHRMSPSLFSDELISATADAQSLDSVRRVLYQQAVIPVSRLYDDVIMPGDFFFEEDEQRHPPQHIDICITPACDLVVRGETKADDIRMLMVRASPVPDNELSDKGKIDRLLKSSESTTSVLLDHLVPEDAMYRVRFKNWYVTTWGDVKNSRRGRLLDPYVTLLQQRYALFSQRQGLPRLPKDFYKPRPESSQSSS